MEIRSLIELAAIIVILAMSTGQKESLLRRMRMSKLEILVHSRVNRWGNNFFP